MPFVSASVEHLVYTEKVGGPNLGSCQLGRSVAHQCFRMNVLFSRRSGRQDYCSRFKEGDGP